MNELNLLDVARRSIEAHLSKSAQMSQEQTSRSPELAPEISNTYDDVHGVFVTLWAEDLRGELRLRGCIGRHCRLFKTIAEEVADCVCYSATEDPRFQPVTIGELNHIKIEISLLGKPETVSDTSELDPAIYGVIVKNGRRQATLLPEIDGIDTVEKQLSAVRQKAGIRADEQVMIFKFSVKKISE
ncbi:MAG: AmmeMemoRadiSam system protein A [Bdellovibrionota bacterium]